MITVNFEELTFRGLLSYGAYDTVIPLNKYPSTLFQGKSGSGKSAILDAFTYVLYGKPYRKIKLGQLINSINQKDCYTALKFSVGKRKYLLERGQKPKILRLTCDGTEIIHEDLQSHLEDNIIKMGFRTFKHVVALGYANFIPFMELEAKDRRELVEEFLDSKVFSMMSVILKNRISEHKTKISDSQRSLDIAETEIAGVERLIRELEANTEDQILALENEVSEHEERIQANNLLLTEHSDKLSELKDKILPPDKVKELNKVYRELIEIKSKAEANIKRDQKSVDYYEKNKTCPECGQAIEKGFADDHITKAQARIAKAEDVLGKLKEKLEKIENKKEKLESLSDKIYSVEREISKIESNNSSSRSQIDNALAKVKKLKSPKSQAKVERQNELKELQKKRAGIAKDLQVLLDKSKVFYAAQSLLKDDGIKAEIVRQYIPRINKSVNSLLNDMDFFVTFNMDENFNEVIKSRGRDDFSYANFSDGEKQRIDLALLFTWIQIAKMKSSINTNVLILDEVLDSHLSTEAAENVINILNSDRFSGMNLFVISHKDALADKFRNVVHFENVKNFSRMIPQ